VYTKWKFNTVKTVLLAKTMLQEAGRVRQAAVKGLENDWGTISGILRYEPSLADCMATE